MDREIIQQTIEESWTLIQRHQSAPAIEKLSGLIRQMPTRGPEFAEAYSYLSHAYRQIGKMKKAISSLRHAIKSAPRNARYRLDLALLLREDQDTIRAMLEARKAVSLDPSLLEARELVAELLLEQGFLDPAIRETGSILRQSPRNLRALDIMGTALLYQGKIGQALETVERMVLVCPNDPMHHFKRAVLLQQRGNTAEAMRVYLQVMEMDPIPEISQRSQEAIDVLDESQIQQILVLAAEDALFRAKLSRNVEMAVQERGYRLSPNGLAILEQVYLPELSGWGLVGHSGAVH